jgi:Tfp pilus assembly protein PilX
MKVRALLTTSAVLASFLAMAVPGSASAAPKQTVKVFMTGDCADGQMVEEIDSDDCEITVSVTPKSAKRSAIIQVAYDSDEVEWEELDSGKTKSGRLIFGVSSTDDDDIWFDGIILYRVLVKKSGGNKAFLSKEYKVAYTSAEAAEDDEDLLEDLAVLDPDEEAFEQKMDQAKSDNQKKINEQQPNQQIKQNTNGENPQRNSDLGSAGSAQPGAPQGNNPPQINEEFIKKACASAGIADCTAIVKLLMTAMKAGKGPDPKELSALVGDKMFAFIKAMGFNSPPPAPK